MIFYMDKANIALLCKISYNAAISYWHQMNNKSKLPNPISEQSLLKLAVLLSKIFPTGIKIWDNLLEFPPTLNDLYREGLFQSADDLRKICESFKTKVESCLTAWEDEIIGLRYKQPFHLLELLRTKEKINLEIREQFLAIIYFLLRYIYYLFDQNKTIDCEQWQRNLNNVLNRIKIITNIVKNCSGEINKLNLSQLIVIALAIGKILFWAIQSFLNEYDDMYLVVEELNEHLKIFMEQEKSFRVDGYSLDMETSLFDSGNLQSSDSLPLFLAIEEFILKITLHDSHPMSILQYNYVENTDWLMQYYQDQLIYLLDSGSLTPDQKNNVKTFLERLSTLNSFLQSSAREN